MIKASGALRDQVRARDGAVPPGGLTAHADTAADIAAPPAHARYAFGAQFAEVRVDADTGEVRVPRLLGVFAAGHIVSPAQARSQLIGGMTMGLSMALHEESAMDPQFGDYPHHDLAGYHIAAHADVQDIDVAWIDEEEPELGPAGAKGIGEVHCYDTGEADAAVTVFWHHGSPNTGEPPEPLRSAAAEREHPLDFLRPARIPGVHVPARPGRGVGRG